MWYNTWMKHWSVDTSELEKNPVAFARWRLEQAINWGIRDGKVSARDLREHWDQLDLDPHKKKFLALALDQ